MAVLTVIRNSRAHEDSGQAELLASGVLARASRLAAAVLMAVIASIALGVVSFLVTVACGGDVVGDRVLAGYFTASGLMFAGVAAVAAQLGSDARTASSIAVGTLGVCYVLRGLPRLLGRSGLGHLAHAPRLARRDPTEHGEQPLARAPRRCARPPHGG